MKKLFYQFIATWMMAAMVVVPTEVRAQATQIGLKPLPQNQTSGIQLSNIKPKLINDSFLKEIGFNKMKMHSLESGKSYNDFLAESSFSQNEKKCLQTLIEKYQLSQFAAEKFTGMVAIPSYAPKKFEQDCEDGTIVGIQLVGLDYNNSGSPVALSDLGLPLALQNYAGIEQAQAGAGGALFLAGLAIGLIVGAAVTYIVMKKKSSTGYYDDPNSDQDDCPEIGDPDYDPNCNR